MSAQRAMPQLQLSAALAGLLLATALVLPLRTLGPLGTALAILLGGVLAGRLAKAGGLLQGAAVGVAAILVFPLLGESSSAGEGVLADTLATMALDALFLGAAALGGWIGNRSRRAR